MQNQSGCQVLIPLIGQELSLNLYIIFIHTIYCPCTDDAENRGLLRALPLVVMKAVTQDMPQLKPSKDVDSGDSEDDISDPVDLMPKHFDKEDLDPMIL